MMGMRFEASERCCEAAEGSSSTSRSTLTSSGAATICNGMYGSLCMYLCMYGGDSDEGKTETMYVRMYACMYVCKGGWMCMGRGRYWC